MRFLEGSNNLRATESKQQLTLAFYFHFAVGRTHSSLQLDRNSAELFYSSAVKKQGAFS